MANAPEQAAGLGRAARASAPAAADEKRVCLLAIDVQNTFCLPDFELFVGGRSGRGAVEDNARLCAFIYRNLASITEIHPTLDTHTVMQIFHPVFLVNADGEHPQPMTPVSVEDVENGCLEGKSGGRRQRGGRRRRRLATTPAALLPASCASRANTC